MMHILLDIFAYNAIKILHHLKVVHILDYLEFEVVAVVVGDNYDNYYFDYYSIAFDDNFAFFKLFNLKYILNILKTEKLFKNIL